MKYLRIRQDTSKRRIFTAFFSLKGMGFTLIEELKFVVSGDSNILRELITGHLLVQAIMGYYYGNARVTGKSIYDVFSLAVPVLVHTFFDMFLINLMAVFGDRMDNLENLSPEEVMNIPYWNYAIPLLIGAVAAILTVFIAMIWIFRKIGAWSRREENQKKLIPEKA